MKLKFLFCLLLIVDLLGTSESHAGLVLQFGESNVVGDNVFSGGVGQTITTQIYLTQTDGETRLSSAATALVIADFRVTIDGANVVPIGTTFGPGFSDDLSGNTGIAGLVARIAEFEAGRTGNVGVTTAVDGIADNSILIGTVSFQIQAGASGTYNLTVARDSSVFPFSLADPTFPISVLVDSGSGTLNVTAVPEPSIVGFGIVGLGVFLSRRRNKKSTTFK